jgi:hypothetical protein
MTIVLLTALKIIILMKVVQLAWEIAQEGVLMDTIATFVLILFALIVLLLRTVLNVTQIQQ